MIDIDVINGRHSSEQFGIARYTNEIFKRLPEINPNTIEYPPIGRSEIIDGAIKRTVYPFIVRSKIRNDTIKHVTNQDLAFLLSLIQLHPSIVTCHDLIPVSFYHKNSLYWKLNLKGIGRADHVITVSEFSKSEINRLTGYPENKITVIHDGVDTSRYFPKKDRAILEKFSIAPEDPVLLFVGSEEPRKNISLVIKALCHLKKKVPGITLLKVGGTQMGGDRAMLMRLINTLNLKQNVVFTDQVPEDLLPEYYNAADIFVFPSYYEGFGLPPLEAMACGCPVISSNTTSLPEVIGDAGIYCNPDNALDLAEKIYDVLINDNLRKTMEIKGIERAKQFTWDAAAARTLNVYLELLLKWKVT